MSLFDAISSSVGSLFDGDVSGAVDSLSNISGSDFFTAAKGAVRGFDSIQQSKDKEMGKEEQLYRFLERNASMQKTDTDWAAQNAPNKTSFGVPKYSADAGDIQREWAAYLQGVANYNPIVPGEKYSKGAI